MRLVGRLAMAIGAAVAAVAASPGFAAASTVEAGGFTYVEKTVSLANFTTLTVAAKCPERAYVLGGGFSNPGADYSDFQIEETYFADDGDPDANPDDEFRVTQHNESGSESFISTRAVCGKKRPDYRRQPFSIPGLQGTPIHMECVGAEKALYSAVRPETGFQLPFRINALFPSDGQYTADIDNSSPPEFDVNTTTTCLEGAHTKVVVQNKPIDGLSRRSAKAVCPKKTFVIGGGGAISGGYDTGELVTADPRPPRKLVSAHSSYIKSEMGGTAEALCMKPL